MKIEERITADRMAKVCRGVIEDFQRGIQEMENAGEMGRTGYVSGAAALTELIDEATGGKMSDKEVIKCLCLVLMLKKDNE